VLAICLKLRWDIEGQRLDAYDVELRLTPSKRTVIEISDTRMFRDITSGSFFALA
jgi:hypothetical protein